MNRPNLRRSFAALAVLATASMMAACSTPPGSSPPKKSYTFKAISAKNVSSNDETCFLGICSGSTDEPYPVNIGFSVQIGKAGSATAQAVVGKQHWDWFNPFSQGPDEGQTYTFEAGAEQAPVTLSNIPLLDVADLLNTNNHLTVAGVWAWAFEGDTDPVGPSGMANTIAASVAAALNSTLATGSLPSDPNQIVSTILGVIGNNLFPTIGSFFANLVPWGDDAIGSRMYVGIGATGTLKGIIDTAAAGATFPSVAIPVVSSPPDIDGGAIFTLGNKSFTDQAMTNGGVDGRHDYAYSLTQN